MKYIIFIKDKETGDVREFSDSDDYLTEEQKEKLAPENRIVFSWLVGHRSCDCSIYCDFYENEEVWPCWEGKFEGKRFEVLSIANELGKAIYSRYSTDVKDICNAKAE